jgi:uncharacterized protein YyaL (SSP411 family)
MPHRFRFVASALLFGFMAGTLSADKDRPAAKDPKPKPKANRLAKETSPYLLQHAHNPVNWYPWGEEAFAKAKKEGKLVFLSVGYSSCHWCHVMEKESFSNEAVAKILNDRFVCIKVDREERPDVDHIYMTALQVMDGRGGWPLSMFLTADGKPIVGGTYWPREDVERDGVKQRGFKSVLKLVDDIWKKEKKGVLKQADQVAEKTQRELVGATRVTPIFEVKRELVEEAVEGLAGEIDPAHGGFGNPARGFRGTKFPTTPRLLLLEEEATRTKKEAVSKPLDFTLGAMARGGIYDHLGGGFHRYSTERTWTVPHFEKMLYDNAQLAEVYALAYKRTKNPVYARVVRETLAFVGRELTAPEGGFYSALDADSEVEEGKFYVWTPKELRDLLPEKADRELFLKVFGADAGPNFEEKYNILRLPKPLAELAAELKLGEEQLRKKLGPMKQKLFAVRSKRERPFLDTKVLTAWNGEMIAGYAVAGQALGEKQYVETATRAADFILKHMRTKEGRLLRTWGAAPGKKGEARLNGYLEDYAFLVHGLLCLHDATKEKRWLDEAKALTDVMVKFFDDGKVGGFYHTSSDHEKLFARAKDQYDGAQPCGNSMAARNLVRLWVKTGDAKYKKLAEKTIRSLAIPYRNNPGSLTTLGSAIGLYLDAAKK